jgi:glutathione synthase/RimK-type ligase-like ATP-grasp enzyme
VVHRDNVKTLAKGLGFPCILKQPDSAFSMGVVKVGTEAELLAECERLFSKSELVIAQEFTPTEFDWRVGIFDREPLWVAKYFMARSHWQIYKKTGKDGSLRGGRVEAIAIQDAPPAVVKTALRASNLIGDGFYGVDLKQVGRRVCVVEVNDNPSVEAGYEDMLLKDALYASVMRVFRKRLDAQLEASRLG